MKPVFKENFYKKLEEEQNISPYYSRLIFNVDNSIFYSCSTKNKTTKGISISLFPSYLTPSFIGENNLNIIKLPQKKIHGFAIFIKESIKIKDFIKLNYKKKFIHNINRYLNRFETCLTPSYKFYFGEITYENYTYLMNKLKNMLEIRFSQRGVVSQNLQNWEHYLKKTQALINTKKASLFVIYVNEEPIQITLNHHYNKNLFITITSFDLNFHKFSVGNIAIYKILEWSLNNNYQMIDMAYGELPYKKDWSNYIYNFEHHILYQKNTLSAKYRAKIEESIIRIKNTLKYINLDNYFDKRYKKNKTPFNECMKYTTYTIPQLLKTNKYILTEFKNENYTCLKKQILNFLFSNKENITQVKIYKNKTENVFFILGKNGAKKICIQCKSNIKKKCKLNKI